MAPALTDPLSAALLIDVVALAKKDSADLPPKSRDFIVNPVLYSAKIALKKTQLVELNPKGIKAAARYIHTKMAEESYTPRTWRAHPLHLVPPETYSPTDPTARATLDWIFMISALNFSFWSEHEGTPGQYGVEWYEGWAADKQKQVVHTGYWSLVAAINKALQAGIPFTDPAFYSSEVACPDSLIAEVFRAAPRCKESIPLLKERIAVLRQVGQTLCTHFGGSFLGLIEVFRSRCHPRGSALQFVHMITEHFPSFRDETWYRGEHLFFWKRAQILTAETWAAFYPADPHATHPFFPSGVHELTMFADYRVPQILHHLRILQYPSSLLQALHAHVPFTTGSQEEVSIRAASICAVEELRQAIVTIQQLEVEAQRGDGRNLPEANGSEVCSVLLDFYLWDLAKKVETGVVTIEGIETGKLTPIHRTRSIWY